MRKLRFLFGSHCHQPVGNFDAVFSDALTGAYEPFFRLLAGYPGLRVSAHLSGPLLEWIEEHKPEFLDFFGGLVESGRLEPLGSGFYEPVLAAIPERDRLGQLEMMNDYLLRRFSTRPQGAWMTERVWEPQVVDALIASGLRYVVIDDFHFKCAGITENEIDGYYLTENDGRPLAVFPISEALRYAIPFQAPEKTIEYLRRAWEAGKSTVTMMDDGEKFGLWPGTRDLCYKEGWLERFFAALEANSEWLELATPTDVLASQPPTGTVYLPSASYFEMSEWTLPADKAAEFSAIVHELQDTGRIERFRPFLRGGIWRNFFSKYPESNNMHKRMLSLSTRLERLRTSLAGNRNAAAHLEHATRELYRSQCNCAYWHGVFGGLYLPHLRHAVYVHLIRTERALDEAEFPGGALPQVAGEDVNMDGVAELILRSPELTAVVSPHYGGALYELDYRPLDFNLLDTLAGRREGYHSAFEAPITAQAKAGDTPSIHDIARNVDENLKASLHYDWHNRYSLLDHCLHPDTTLQKMTERTFRELGDFVNQPYKGSASKGKALLIREGALYTDEGVIILTIEKALSLDGGKLAIDYKLRSGGSREAEFVFAPELNFSMLSSGDELKSYYALGKVLEDAGLDSAGEVAGCREFGILDRRLGLKLTLLLDRKADVWYFPSNTISQSETGFELNYQSSVVIPHRRLKLAPGAEWVCRLVLSAGRPDSVVE
jgi:alpha-amylase/alpha-mannosidase (GH57 family)